MPFEENGVKFYEPAEAAEFLGISKASLSYYRREGRVKGLGTGNSTLYTESALRKFKHELETGEARRAPGPKPRKKSKQADGDEPSV